MTTTGWVRLEPRDYERVQPLTENLETIHLRISAILAGTCHGAVYADSAERPRTACIELGVLRYLVGDPGNGAFCRVVADWIPRDTYCVLLFESTEWVTALSETLEALYFVRASSRHLRLAELRSPAWAGRVPAGYAVRRVDAALLSEGLKNTEDVIDGITGEWSSVERFVEDGFGFCLVAGDTIASWSLTDFVHGDRCEIGIDTDRGHRRRGLGTLAATATAAHALERGLRHVGWHCWANNLGSLGVARNVGFELVADYDVYINHWAAENVTDITEDEFRDFALGYERAFELRPPTTGYPHIVAATAWSLAGDRAGCYRHLNLAVDLGWLRSIGHLREIWPELFWNPNLGQMPEWRALAARLEGEIT